MTAIYLPSFLIAVTARSPLASGRNLFGDVFAIADEVSPAAKISFAILFGGLLLAVRRFRGTPATLVDMMLGMAAMFLVIALLPAAWSRGFGIGLSGTRFDLLPTAIYLVGGVLSGLAFSISESRCIARNREARG